ncbi:MAG: guanylate kinase [candidate division Zixibacteria bacterium RBG_16_53_22]|nr:MAG: guanylate kinase [candidate division Zixibacteria bacterium RBG_16_53_22]
MAQTKQPGLVAILSSPSGTGKTTICHMLMKKHPEYKFSISATTRPNRGKERDGVDYYFVSDERFDSMIQNNELAEWAYVFGHRYGTPFSEITNAIAADRVLLCDIDVQGGMTLKDKYRQAVTIFLIPPSLTELRRRLFHRRTDSSEQRKMRLETAVKELGYWHRYDYIVLNEDLKEATNEVDMIIAAERAKTIRRNERRFWESGQAGLLGL